MANAPHSARSDLPLTARHGRVVSAIAVGEPSPAAQTLANCEQIVERARRNGVGLPTRRKIEGVEGVHYEAHEWLVHKSYGGRVHFTFALHEGQFLHVSLPTEKAIRAQEAARLCALRREGPASRATIRRKATDLESGPFTKPNGKIL
jgi:hypothetical protein